jgi:protein-L-isoaspartate(D-aspartate) O-methyltransferase
MTDFAMRRTVMVDTQVRPSDVTKFPIIDAMLSVQREAFVPANRAEIAYLGEDLDFGGGRALLAPRSFAKLLDALNPRTGDLVLDVGCLWGYSTAVLARLADAVVALDTPEHVAEAEARLAEHGVDNAICHAGTMADGVAAHGPYDVVLIEGGVETLPEALGEQLKEGGRIGALFLEGSLGIARIGVRSGDRVMWRDAFHATAPVLPGFGRRDTFRF